MTKNQNLEMPEINRKPSIVNGYHYKKIAKELLFWLYCFGFIALLLLAFKLYC